MNTILIVLPIITVLMFEIGLTFNIKDFRIVLKHPKTIITGLIGQIIILPIIAISFAIIFNLDPIYIIGLVLIAASPGGSSSNIFTYLAKGDVALSVLLTALSSFITLFTIPLVMSLTTSYVNNCAGTIIELPTGKLLVQNIILMLVPILLGILCRKKKPCLAEKLHKLLSKIAFPALMLLAGTFFFQHHKTIIKEFTHLGLVITTFILVAIGVAALLTRIFKLKKKYKRTIIIEVGMQNAAQAITVASSPFIFNNDLIAIPAIIYALMMNIVLLLYLIGLKAR